MLKTKITLFIAAVLILTSSAAAAPIIEEFNMDPESPEKGEEFTVTITAEDTRDEVMEIGLESVDETPSNRDTSSEYRFCGDVSCTEEWDIVFDEDGEYELMAEAVNYRDESERQFKTVVVDTDLEPIELSLDEPGENADNLDLRPDFSWSVSGGEGDTVSDFYLKEKSFEDELPWTDPDFSEDDTGTSFSLDEDLDYDTEYVWGVEVTDEEDQSATESRKFTTKEEPEAEINAEFSFDPEDPVVDEEITFDASDSEADNDIVEYTWDFDDNTETTTTSETVDYSYEDEGSYDVSLEVEDEEGNTDSTEKTVEVEKPEPECGVSSGTVGDLNLEENTIYRGDHTEASIEVENTGAEQDVKVEITADGELFSRTTKSIDEGSSERFSTKVSPEEDSTVRAEVFTVGDPCGDRDITTRSDTLKVLTPIVDEKGHLKVEVEDRDSNSLEDARVEVENSESKTGFTDSDGAVEFKLEAGRYYVDVSKPGYRAEEKPVNIREDEKESLRFTLEETRDKSRFNAIVRDRATDSRVEDAEVLLENSESYKEETDRRGRASFDIKPDSYDVTVSKENYNITTDEIEVEKGDEKTRNYYLTDEEKFKGPYIKDIDSPEKVCKGDTLEADVEMENRGDRNETVSLTGTGLGIATATNSFPIDADQTRTETLRFTKVEGDGEEEFSITLRNSKTDRVNSTVNVEDCITDKKDRKEEISDLTAELEPREIVEGDTTRVSGYVRGVRGSTSVEIDVEGQDSINIATDRDGYYSTYIRPERVGKQSVTVSAGEKSISRSLEVLPTSRVSSVTGPRTVFEGDEFEICADVSSQVTPKVTFERNERVLETRNDAGELCFEDTAKDPGTHVYKVNSFVHSQASSGSTEVEVLERRSDAETFPDRFASVRSGEGLVKVDLYNNENQQKTYDLEIDGIDDRWVTQSTKEVILNPGEPKTVYFYFTPRAEGEFRPVINVFKEGEKMYEEEIIMEIGGRDRPERLTFRQRLSRLISFI